jgi:CO/xanthine dehydrogenase FAD-binding subunit
MTDYQRPETLPEATALLAVGPRVVLAGGTDLFPATPALNLSGRVLDLGALEELRGIDRVDGFLRIGAATSWSEVAQAGLPSALTALQQAAAEVGGRQIQNTATVGGNLCNASPAADGVPPLLAADAEVELASSAGRRRLPLERFLLGPRRTARGPEEILTAILVPETALRGASTFLKLGARRHLVISIAMAAARLVIEDGRIAEARLALGACGPVATRLPAVEAALLGAKAGPSAAERIDAPAVAAALAPITDTRATAEYRLEAATVLLRRVVTRLVWGPQ